MKAITLATALLFFGAMSAAQAQSHGGGSHSGGGHASSGSSGHASGGGHAASGGGHSTGTHASGGSSSGTTTHGGSTATRSTGASAPHSRVGETAGRTADGGEAHHGRTRDGAPAEGTAVPRGTSRPVPPTVISGGGYYPWYYGGVYGLGYYDPWWGVGGYPDPYGGYPAYGSQSGDEGALRLKVSPKQAEVYVDGYYVGLVDDFDGLFQKLPMQAGPHHLEIRAAGYEPLVFDVQIEPGKKITYSGDLKRIQ